MAIYRHRLLPGMKDGLTASSDRMMGQLNADHGRKQVTSGRTNRGQVDTSAHYTSAHYRSGH